MDLLLVGAGHQGRRSSGSARARPDSREQITYGDWNDEDASLSPDGKRLYFTSDRVSGILQHLLHQPRQRARRSLYTNVVAGCFPPVVRGHATTRKDSCSPPTTSGASRSTSRLTPRSRPQARRVESRAVSRPGPRVTRPTSPPIEVSVDPEKIDQKPSPQAASSRTPRSTSACQCRPDVRLQHRARLRRQLRRPPSRRLPDVGLLVHRLRSAVPRPVPEDPEGRGGVLRELLLPGRQPAERDRSDPEPVPVHRRQRLRHLPSQPLLPHRDEPRGHLAALRRLPDLVEPVNGIVSIASDNSYPTVGAKLVGDTTQYRVLRPASRAGGCPSA